MLWCLVAARLGSLCTTINLNLCREDEEGKRARDSLPTHEPTDEVLIAQKHAVAAFTGLLPRGAGELHEACVTLAIRAILPTYQASSSGLVCHIGRPGAFASHRQQSTNTCFLNTRYRTLKGAISFRIQDTSHINAIVCTSRSCATRQPLPPLGYAACKCRATKSALSWNALTCLPARLQSLPTIRARKGL